MKKALLTIISLAVLMGMVACANDNNNNTNNNNQNDVTDQNTTTDKPQSPDNDGNIEDDQEDNFPEALADFEETQTLSEQIDLNTLDPEIETDNQNNRVIIFSDASETKKYKSVFIKKQNRLKIISLDHDGQIFNEAIE